MWPNEIRYTTDEACVHLLHIEDSALCCCFTSPFWPMSCFLCSLWNQDWFVIIFSIFNLIQWFYKEFSGLKPQLNSSQENLFCGLSLWSTSSIPFVLSLWGVSSQPAAILSLPWCYTSFLSGFPELQPLHIHWKHENYQNQFTHKNSFYLFQLKQLPVKLHISKKANTSQVICFLYPLPAVSNPSHQFNSLASLPALNCEWESESRNFWARSHKPNWVGKEHAHNLLASLRNQKY